MKHPILPAAACLLLLGACASKGELDESGGITAVRTPCPAVGVPAGTGDVTLFDPATSRDATALDLTATMTNVRSTCNDAGEQVVTTVTFDVDGVRRQAAAARDVTLPYFIAVTRGGSEVIAKRVGAVALHFDAGKTRAATSAQASTQVTRAAATLPDDVRKELTKKRKAGDEDAATDPLTRPNIRTAVLKASFEALVGFQLTDDQLKYNVTR